MKQMVSFCLVLWLTCTLSSAQAKEKVIWSFGAVPNDGTGPTSSLVSDSAGNLFGTTPVGGANSEGIVFELSPQFDGTWNETILYNFCSQTNCSDGFQPEAGLVLDASGNLYGTTEFGGTEPYCGSEGCGTVFEMSPNGDGTWTHTVIYNLCANYNGTRCVDAANPVAPLTFDALGNLYGTSGGGNGGDVFELSPSSSGWIETVLYNFCSRKNGNFCVDGSSPRSGVTFNASGSLFGTTFTGGRYSLGVVYQLTPGSRGWTQQVLLAFYASGNSDSPVSFDAGGNLYSTTPGVAFQLNAKHQSYRAISFSRTTGNQSHSGMVVDAVRNALFGTSANQGANGAGTVWEVNPARQLVPIYNFCSQSGCMDGSVPKSPLIEDSFGNLYGTAQRGGEFGEGVVFEVTP